MGVLIDILVGLVLLVAAVALLALLYVNLRAQALMRRVGAFRCWVRPDSQSGWTSGIAHYGVETLEWYKLVARSGRPALVLPRRGLEISAPVNRAADGSVVEVRVRAGDRRVEFAIAPQTYNGIVSWISSGPPQERARY